MNRNLDRYCLPWRYYGRGAGSGFLLGVLVGLPVLIGCLVFVWSLSR
jgi:hypothetical protein